MAKSILFEPVESPYLVPFDGSFKIAKADTDPPEDAPDKKDNVEAVEKCVKKLTSLQARLYAQDRYSVVLIIQALDAAGKDGTIRSVMSGVIRRASRSRHSSNRRTKSSITTSCGACSARCPSAAASASSIAATMKK